MTTGPRWFKALDAALPLGSGADLQLCMMNPAHALASTTMCSATNGRGTQDHADRSAANGLPLGWSALVLHALGLWPSRDNVWTNSSVDLGVTPESHMTEKMPVLQTAMAVLAGGPYGVADIAGALNKSLVMRSCRTDGVLLRPSWPATAIDASFRVTFDSLDPLYLWAAHSYTCGLTFVYLLSINLDTPLRVKLADLVPMGGVTSYVVAEAWHGIGRGAVARKVLGDSLTLPPTPQTELYVAGHSLWFVAPVLAGGWAYLGEADKIIKASHRRVTGIDVITAAGDAAVGAAGGAAAVAGRSRLVVRLLLARNETATASVLTPGDAVLTGVCEAGLGVPHEAYRAAAFGDVDVAMVLTCRSAACQCVPDTRPQV